MISNGQARIWTVATCFVGAVGIGSGCSNEKPGANPPTVIQLAPASGAKSPQDVLAKLPGGDEFADGKNVYANNKCATCHKLGDTGGGMVSAKGAAPELTKVGAAPEHTKQWLAEHIRDARKHQAESRMPPYPPDKISDGDLGKLVEYLASRK